MKRTGAAVSVLVILLLSAIDPAPAASPSPAWSKHELATLKACEGIVRLFQAFPESVWPGYDLAKRTFLVYIPERWALLFNPPPDAEGFGPTPEGWPDFGVKVGFHAGPYDDLAGQLAFDFPIGSAKAVAIGIQENPEAPGPPESGAILGFIVHEAFHQFQNETFGEIPWEREERYPILDAGNSALAGLEMRILQDAVDKALSGATSDARALAGLFLAARDFRWKAASPFVARYERGQEIREGTASYVEKRGLELARTLEFPSALPAGAGRLKDDLAALPIRTIFKNDFANRLTSGAVGPGDVIRNRIYPIGSALGFLADFLAPGWKKALAGDIEGFSFGRYLSEKLGVKEVDASGRLEEAKRRYDYRKILASTSSLIEAYRAGFEKDFASFSAQAGTRIEIRIENRSLSRSRSSTGAVWVMDAGARTLHSRVRVYALKAEGLSLQVRNAPIFEENDWDKRVKTVTFFLTATGPLTLDGAAPPAAQSETPRPFHSLAFSAADASFSATIPGTISFKGGLLRIEIR